MSVAAARIRELHELSDEIRLYNDGRFHLSSKLYVPRAYVDQYHLEQFTFMVDDEIELLDGTTEITKVPINLWQEHGSLYSFHRGNIQKLLNLWPQLIEDGMLVDHRSKEPLTFDLQLKPGFTYREYPTGNQYDALQALLNPNVGGLLKAFPSFGKTVMMTLLAICQRQKVLLLAHKSDLLDQFENTVRSITNIDDFINPDDGWCWNMYRLDKNHPTPNIGTSTFAYLLANPDYLHTIKNDYGIIMVDECHHLGSEGFTQVFLAFNATYRYGFTATDYRRDGMDVIFDDIIGPVRADIPRPPIAVDGFIVDTDCHIPDKYTYSNFPMNLAHNYLSKNKERNRLIADNALRDMIAGHITIILVYRVEQIDLIYDELCQLIDEYTQINPAFPINKEQVEWIYRTFTKEDRDQVRDRLEEGANPDTIGGSKVVITTSQLFGEGSDYPILSSLHFCFPTSNRKDLEQILGRIMRVHKWKPARNKITFYRDKGMVQVMGIAKGWINKMREFGVQVFDKREADSGKVGSKLGLWK